MERCETCFQYHKNFSNYNGVQCYTHARKFAHSIRLKLMFLLFFLPRILYFYFAIAKCDLRACMRVQVCGCVVSLVVALVHVCMYFACVYAACKSSERVCVRIDSDFVLCLRVDLRYCHSNIEVMR